MRRVGTATASRGFQCTMFSFISRTPRCGSNAPLPSICNLKHLFVLSRGERDRACPAQIGARVRDKHADAGSSPFSGKDGHGGDDVQIRPRRHIVSQLQSVIGKRDVPIKTPVTRASPPLPPAMHHAAPDPGDDADADATNGSASSDIFSASVDAARTRRADTSGGGADGLNVGTAGTTRSSSETPSPRGKGGDHAETRRHADDASSRRVDTVRGGASAHAPTAARTSRAIAHATAYLRQAANEPSVGQFYVREHCRKSVTQLARAEATVRAATRTVADHRFESKGALEAVAVMHAHGAASNTRTTRNTRAWRAPSGGPSDGGGWRRENNGVVVGTTPTV